MTRVVVAPDEMRRTATILRDSSGRLKELAGTVRGHSLPEMPAEIAGRVKSEIGEVASSLASAQSRAPLLTDAKELQVRALWAEIADARSESRNLSSAQLREVLALMKDGSLLRYASPAEKAWAGRLLGTTYRSKFEDPQKLIELAGLMRKNAHDKDFAGGFITTFGVDNVAKIPRVIQAIEYPTQIGNQSYPGGSQLRRDIAVLLLDRDGTYKYDGDVVKELLAPFTQALAVASYSGTLARDQQRALGRNGDQWAVAALLSHSSSKYGKDLLLEAFDKGVVDRIVYESKNRLRWDDISNTDKMFALGRSDNEGGLALDPKVTILNALARNGDAAADALTSDMEPVKLLRPGPGGDPPGGITVRDPLQLLLEIGVYQDDGRALGEMSASGIAGLHEDGRHAPANHITLRMIDAVIGEERNDLDGIRQGVARTVAEPGIMSDLHSSASNTESRGDWDPDRDGVIGQSDKDGVAMSTTQLRDLLAALSDDDTARERLLGGVSLHQANEILDATGPDGPSNGQWASELGNFNGILTDANSENRLEDFEKAKARHEQIFKAIDTVTGAIPMGQVGGMVTSELIDSASAGTAPDQEPVLDKNYESAQEMRGRLEAAIATGYYENGRFGDADDIRAQIPDLPSPGHTPKDFLDRNGHILPIDSMDRHQLGTFREWLKSDPVQDVVREPFDTAGNGVDARAK